MRDLADVRKRCIDAVLHGTQLVGGRHAHNELLPNELIELGEHRGGSTPKLAGYVPEMHLGLVLAHPSSALGGHKQGVLVQVLLKVGQKSVVYSQDAL